MGGGTERLDWRLFACDIVDDTLEHHYMINRRELFRNSLIAAGAVAAFSNIDCAPQQQSGSQVSSFELDELTIAQLSRFTSRSLTEKYLARIDALNRKGPELRAVLEVNPDALAIADLLDQERQSKGPRGPLHGIPVLIKDNIDTADRMTTTAGSLALEGSTPEQDSGVAQRLRAAGAVILGKTNLSEWANFRSTHSSSGWSGRGGQTKNPYALDRNPSGSSSGTGAAVAANLCAAGVGSETDGSIVSPSALNGIVGIKPTLGVIPGNGIIPIAHSQDTAGPMARTVTDAAILLGALSGGTDYTRFLDAKGLRGARLGVARKFFGYNRDVDKLMENCIAEMKRQGAVIVDPADLPSYNKYNDAEFDVLLYEFKADLNKYLAGLKSNVRARTLKDIIDFNEFNARREMPYFGQEIMIMAEAKGPLTDQAYLDALAKSKQGARAEGIDAVVKQFKVDAIIAPSGGPAWLTDLVTGDHDAGGSSTPAAVAGYPNISVPAGYSRGLPVGLSFFGPANSEGPLIKFAYAFEQATKFRAAPKFLPSAPLA
jgi:amidase